MDTVRGVRWFPISSTARFFCFYFSFDGKKEGPRGEGKTPPPNNRIMFAHACGLAPPYCFSFQGAIALCCLVHFFIVTASIVQPDGTAPMAEFADVFDPNGDPQGAMIGMMRVSSGGG